MVSRYQPMHWLFVPIILSQTLQHAEDCNLQENLRGSLLKVKLQACLQVKSH